MDGILRSKSIIREYQVINLLKRILFINRESTATIVLRNWLSQGITPDDITPDHIQPVYRTLRKISTAPDFTPIQDLLPTECQPGQNASDPVWGVIVETRKHPALERVIDNFIEQTQIPIQLFHGINNLDFIRSTKIEQWIQEGKVLLTLLNVGDLTLQMYNALFLSKRFWNLVLGRAKILVFQTDTLCCPQSEYSLEDFVNFDYIGSKWPRWRPVGLIADGGNGGLSLRDWNKTYECLNRFPPENWVAGEDGYFAFHIELIGGKVGKDIECAKFGTQREFLFKSWGAHQISCLNKKNRKRFIRYCPEAKFLLDSK